MAAGTALNITLTAKDWEAFIGISWPISDPEIIDVWQQLADFYRAAVTKPLQNDNIVVASTESVVVKIATSFYYSAARNTFRDNGGNAMNRVMSALRLLNNAADNYVNTSLAAFDTDNSNAATQLKKYGRAIILNKNYDNQ